MANPLTPLGTLNRIRASVIVSAFPDLTVTSPYMGTDGVSLSFTGEQTNLLPSLTGNVLSPAPYQTAVLKMHLLRTQNLSNSYKLAAQLNTVLGVVTVIPDSSSLDNFIINNAALVELAELPFTGRDAGFMVTIQGTYYINSTLYLGA
jgi:hypothetical protein